MQAAAAHAALTASLSFDTASYLAGLLAEHDAEEPLSQPVSECTKHTVERTRTMNLELWRACGKRRTWTT